MILLWYHYVKKQDNTILLHFFFANFLVILHS